VDVGNGGNDKIKGLKGNDRLCGGPGKDKTKQ
jgi:Ca2+-binding RTX toxin-like protein